MEFKTATDLWIEAEENLKSINPSKICNFGISVLDDALYGILPNDLITFGADSGAGKSELGLDIAVHNASNGKKVCLFFIEGGGEEAINRIRWKYIKNRYYEQGFGGVDMDYTKWRMGMLKCELMDKLNLDSYLFFNEKVKDNLFIYCFEQGFTINNLINSLGYFTKQEVQFGMFVNVGYEIDLIVIDHLQYFTLENPKNELTEMTQILMKVKDITNFHKIPVILISHLRKKDKDRGLPSQDDFFGTSNTAKISSQAITLSSHYSGDDYQKNLYPTFFRFVKSRTGLRPSIGVLCNFDATKGKYEDSYDIFRLEHDKPMPTPLERFKLPKWAYKALLKREGRI